MEFSGVERRFQLWGEESDVRVYHDYAHHPTEVRVTLETARKVIEGGELHVLFQPHQHSRTARFLGDFVKSLCLADRVVVSDVYGARLHIDTESAGSEELVTRLKRAHVEAVFGGDLASSVSAALERVPAGGGLLVLGAGDVDGIRDELLNSLALRCALVR
jgi:UDP-N-acetylmuramate--alanine ligase